MIREGFDGEKNITSGSLFRPRGDPFSKKGGPKEEKKANEDEEEKKGGAKPKKAATKAAKKEIGSVTISMCSLGVSLGDSGVAVTISCAPWGCSWISKLGDAAFIKTYSSPSFVSVALRKNVFGRGV